LRLVSNDVNWPDDSVVRPHGKDHLHAYLTEQWSRTRMHDEPVGFGELNDGRVAVHISQVVRPLDGSVLAGYDQATGACRGRRYASTPAATSEDLPWTASRATFSRSV
jgi:hypothetical protein